MNSNETCTISLPISRGELSKEQLELIASVMKKYKIPMMKITGAKGITLAGVKREDCELVRKELNFTTEGNDRSPLRAIQSCWGGESCLKGSVDAPQFAEKLEQKLDDAKLPGKVKIAVSGCEHCCAQSMVRDIGLIAKPKGWTLTVGGLTGGIKPRLANVLAEGLSDEKAMVMVKKILDTYQELGKPRERIGRTIERMGLEAFK